MSQCAKISVTLKCYQITKGVFRGRPDDMRGTYELSRKSYREHNCNSPLDVYGDEFSLSFYDFHVVILTQTVRNGIIIMK